MKTMPPCAAECSVRDYFLSFVYDTLNANALSHWSGTPMNGATAIAARPKSGWLLLLARWVAALLILLVLVYFLPVAQLRLALSAIPPKLFAALLAVYLFALLVGIFKWHIVLNAANSSLPFSVSAQCYVGGIFGALFLPSILGGDVVRLGVGISHSPRPAAVVTGNFVDRLLDALAQLTLVLFGLVFLPGSLPSALHSTTRRLLLVVVILPALVLAALAILRRRLPGRSIRFRRRLVQLRWAQKAVSQRPYRIFLAFLLGLLVQTTFLTVTMLLGMSCGLRLPFHVWLFAWPLSKFAAILPLTQGGIGVRETALLGLLAPFGAPAAQVVATGIASEGIIIAGGLISGLTAFLLRRTESQRKPSTAL
jgi:uncharacterized protein (TIRG00374 family)